MNSVTLQLRKVIPLCLIVGALGCFAPPTQAVVPPPDGVYSNFTTAEGQNALQSLTSGAANTALGAYSLFSASTASFNTAVGAGALDLNTGDSNTAVGVATLLLNTGMENTAVGVDALGLNTTGDFNAAVGAFALYNNTTSSGNTAYGAFALYSNTTGSNNTAVGFKALENVTGGASNVAIGDSTLVGSTTGSFNTVVGDGAGQEITDGLDNIYIGATAGNGFGNENSTMRIGDPAHVFRCFIAGIAGVAVAGDQVVVNANGRLGVPPAGSPLSANELLKEHQIVQQLKARIALQEGQIQALTVALKQQGEQIQKVSGQLALSKPAPQTIVNKQ
jgi:hypothetical protein